MDTETRSMSRTFKALADPTRLRIVGLLLGGEVCVCDIHESLGIPQPKASRHLAYLKRMGLVEDRKAGLWVRYRLAEPEDRVLQTLIGCVRHCLTHLTTTARDRKRLAKQIGYCPERADSPALSFTCCSDAGDADRKSPG